MWPLLFLCLVMKKVTLLIFILNLAYTSVTCQEEDWSYIYDHDLTYEDFTGIEVLNDTIYLAHNQYDHDTVFFGVVLMKLDTFGKVIDTIEFFNPDRILTTYNFLFRLQNPQQHLILLRHKHRLRYLPHQSHYRFHPRHHHLLPTQRRRKLHRCNGSISHRIRALPTGATKKTWRTQ